MLGHAASWIAPYSFVYNAALSTTAPAGAPGLPKYLVVLHAMMDALYREVGLM